MFIILLLQLITFIYFFLRFIKKRNAISNIFEILLIVWPSALVGYFGFLFFNDKYELSNYYGTQNNLSLGFIFVLAVLLITSYFARSPISNIKKERIRESCNNKMLLILEKPSSYLFFVVLLYLSVFIRIVNTAYTFEDVLTLNTFEIHSLREESTNFFKLFYYLTPISLMIVQFRDTIFSQSLSLKNFLIKFIPLILLVVSLSKSAILESLISLFFGYLAGRTINKNNLNFNSGRLFSNKNSIERKGFKFFTFFLVLILFLIFIFIFFAINSLRQLSVISQSEEQFTSYLLQIFIYSGPAALGNLNSYIFNEGFLFPKVGIMSNLLNGLIPNQEAFNPGNVFGGINNGTFLSPFISDVGLIFLPVYLVILFSFLSLLLLQYKSSLFNLIISSRIFYALIMSIFTDRFFDRSTIAFLVVGFISICFFYLVDWLFKPYFLKKNKV